METQATTINTSSFADMVDRAYRQEQGLQGNRGTLESVITSHFAQMSAKNHLWKRDTFRMLLLHLYNESCFTILRSSEYIAVLANISSFGHKKVRDIQGWKKQSFVPEEQLASLIRHCFAKYPTPEFLENAFATDNKVQMYWYIQLGRGDSVLTLSGFPVAFTNKMAHAFRLTPPAYTVAQAIRRAQALGYGATAKRAEVIAWSALADRFESEYFWSIVLQFVVKVEEDITLDKLQVVLEYLEMLRAQQPDMKMKGRTWEALLRQAEEWHAEMAKKREAEGYEQWNRVPIADFYKEEDEVTYCIVQLTSSEQLYEEGYEMSHCVADYTDDCADGSTSIFSLRKYVIGTDGFERMATIKVYPDSKLIAEAKGKYNEMPTETQDRLIKEWAAKENLIPDYDYDDGFYQPVPPQEPQRVEPPQVIEYMNRFAARIERPALIGEHNHYALPPRRRENNDNTSVLLFVKLAFFMLIFLSRACNHKPEPGYKVITTENSRLILKQIGGHK